jgi:hypothetical protein
VICSRFEALAGSCEAPELSVEVGALCQDVHAIALAVRLESLRNIYRDIPRGRKRKGWKEEFFRTLKDVASDVGDLSEKQIIESVRSHRSASPLQPEIEVVS